MTRPLARWTALLPALVALVVLGMLAARWSAHPLDAYGEGGAEYIEHFDRIRTLEIWRANSGKPLDFLVAADGAYPPLLHALALPAGALTGHSAHQITWIGAFWYLLLALGIGLCGWALADATWGLIGGITAGLLFPAGHAAALRYYYDLPMTALLWLGLGVALVGARRSPIIAGLGGGFLTGLAALIKWTAIPFAAPMLLAAALTPRLPRSHRKLLALGLCLGFLLPTSGYLSQSTRSWNEMMSTFGTETGAVSGVVDAAARMLSIDPNLQPPDRGEQSGGRLARGLYYIGGLVVCLYSPVLFLLVIGLGLLWVRSRGRGGWLVGLIVLGQGVFVVAAVPPLDERFLLTLGPALLLPALLGWRELPSRWQPFFVALFVLVGLSVAADFHLREVSDAVPRPAPEVGIQASSAGLGLNSSWEQRGWGRRDRRRDARGSYRERLWNEVERVDAKRVGIVGGPLVDPFGDENWWSYRALLGEIEGGWRQRGALVLVELCRPGPPPDVDIVLATDSRIDEAQSPWCPVTGDWQPGRRIPGDRQHRGAVVWNRAL